MSNTNELPVKSFVIDESLSQAVLDALTANIAVIDAGGIIRMVNAAWRRFAQENSEGKDISATGVGTNYLEICKRAVEQANDDAGAALKGILGVLSGELSQFTLEYPCHSPLEKRWFLMNVTPLARHSGTVVAHINITGRKLAEEAVQRSEARIRRLIESNILGVFFWRGRHIIEANEIFLSMLGYSRQDLLAGKLRWTDLTPSKYRELDTQMIAVLKRLGALSTPYEKEFRRKDGTLLPILIGTAYIDEAQEEGVSFVLDLSERKELERQKDDFFHMVSHELKTPLSNIWILTRLLNKQLAEQGFQDASGNLAQLGIEARQLMKLLTDVLEVAQLQEGYALYTEEQFDMNVLVQEIVTTLQQVTPAHPIIVSGTINKPVIGDRFRIGQVLNNLLTNAIKYSNGHDPIHVLLSSTDEQLNISVRDYGPGIPREQQDKIFERFYRSQQSRRDGTPGFGLGLHISREIITRHGGTIQVESEEGKGSTFIVTLPLRS
jgi:PAS domain S-box-containing protein